MALNLNIDIKDTDTSFPVLKAGMHEMIIKETNIAPNKAGNGNNLLVVFATTEESESLSGDTLKPGFTVRKYYPLQDSEKDNSMWKRNLATLIDAALKIKNPSDRPLITEEVIASLRGESVKVTTKIEHSAEYGPQANVSSVNAL